MSLEGYKPNLLHGHRRECPGWRSKGTLTINLTVRKKVKSIIMC